MSPTRAARELVAVAGSPGREQLRYVGGRRLPRRKPIRPVDIDPVPESTARIAAALAARLPPLELPVLRRMPDGTVPQLAGEFIDELTRGQELAPDVLSVQAVETRLNRSAGAATSQFNAAERDRSAQASADLVEGERSADARPAAVPRVLVDFREPPGTLPPLSRQLADSRDVLQSLARVSAQLSDTIGGIVQSARETAFPKNRIGTRYTGISNEMTAPLEKRLEAKIGELGHAMGVSQTELATVVEARRKELENIAAGRRTEAGAGAQEAVDHLVAESHKKAAAGAAGAARADRDLVRRLKAALRSSKPELVRELVARRLSVIHADVAAGRLALEKAAAHRRELLDRAEQAYLDAYEAADFAAQQRMPEEDRHGVDEGDQVWVDVAADELRAAMTRRRDQTAISKNALTTELDEAGTAATAALHAWADRRTRSVLTAEQSHARESENAAAQARAIDEARQKQAEAATREQLTGQIRLVAAIQAEDAAALSGETSDQAERIEGAAANQMRDLLAAGQGDPIEAIAIGIRAQFSAAEIPARAEEIHTKVYALQPDTYADMVTLGDVIFPRGAGDLATRVDTLWRAFEGPGTTEDNVYSAMEGLDQRQSNLLAAAYGIKHDESLKGRIESEMSGDEKDRALALLQVDTLKLATAMISQSEHWYGKDPEKALAAVRNLPPAEAAKLAADPETMNRLKRVLGGWTRKDDSSFARDERGATQVAVMLELKQAQAAREAAGPDRPMTAAERHLQARADAIEADRAIRREGRTADLDALSRVYDRMRQSLRADPRAAARSTEEFEAELRRRIRAMENAYQAEFGRQLRTVLQERVESGAGRDIAMAQLSVDTAAELAGRLQLAQQGFFYASDRDINKAMAMNYDRALEEVDRWNQLREQVAAKTEELVAAAQRKPGKPPITEEERAAYRKEAREVVAMAEAERSFARVSQKFGARYAEDWGGDPATALETMLIDQTQFGGEKEALARLSHGGGLTVAEQVRFAVTGPGMDRDEVLGALQERTTEQLERIDAEYQRYGEEHGEDTDMKARLKDESGSWSDETGVQGLERNAFDVREALKGIPVTPEEKLKAAKRRLEFEEVTYFRGNPLGRQMVVGFELATMRDQYRRADEAYTALSEATKRVDAIAIRQARGGFANAQAGVMLAADAYRKAVDEHVEKTVRILSTVAAIMAVAIVGTLSLGAATPLVAAIAASLASTAMSMAVKTDILGSAYGKQQVTEDLIVGAVDVVVSALTYRLGDILLRVPALKAVLPPGAPVTKEAMQAAQKALSLVRQSRPAIARAGASMVEQIVQGAPSAMTATLQDRAAWKGDIGTAVLQSGATAGGTNIAMATGMKVAGSGLSLAGRTVKSLFRGGSREIDLAGGRSAVIGATPKERLALQKEWLAIFPDRTPADFRAALENARVAAGTLEEAMRLRRREMTTELLAGIPAAERSRHLDTPVIVLTDAEFTARTGSVSRGQAATLVVDGRPVVVAREGAPLTVLREEGKHVAQIRDPANAAKVALLNENRKVAWASLSLEEKAAAWRAKLDLELEVQQQIHAELETQLARPDLTAEQWAAFRDRLDDAAAAREVMGRRRAELDQPGVAGQSPPHYLNEEPRLFSKAKGPPTEPPVTKIDLEATDNPAITMEPVKIDKDGVRTRLVHVTTPDGVRLVSEFTWDERGFWYRPEAAQIVEVTKDGKKRWRVQRWLEVFLPERGEIRVAEQRAQSFSKEEAAEKFLEKLAGEPPTKRRWSFVGEAGRTGGYISEIAARTENARWIAEVKDGNKRVQFSAQEGGGQGFDDIVFTFAGDGVNVSSAADLHEIKDYPTRAVQSLSAVEKNLNANLAKARSGLQTLLDRLEMEGGEQAAGMTKAELRAALKALNDKDYTITLRMPKGGKASERVTSKFTSGRAVPLAGREEHALAFWISERYRLEGGARAEQFKTLAQGYTGETVESIQMADVVVTAQRQAGSPVNGTVSWSLSGTHLVDEAGPLVVIHPVGGAGGAFDARAAADRILDAAATPRLDKAGKQADSRVIVAYSSLNDAQARQLQRALETRAAQRKLEAAAKRCFTVDYPPPPKPAK
ncbi:hypothetical protein ACIBQ1_03500 [Nonomuraea sp. NPDC050153]|uniref:hypothetical protein n=1 Tax=Nonomuraea sp. NPDC050153 TaxID=3364359 RepID=UPI0037BB244E